MEDTVIKKLMDFVETAEKNRKYSYNTAAGFKAALRRFEPQLREEELKSIDAFKAHLSQIYQEVVEKNKKEISLETLAIYEERVKKVLEDYLQYGVDPTKISTWEAKRFQRRLTHVIKEKEGGERGVLLNESEKSSDSSSNLLEKKDMRVHEEPLESGKSIIITPKDITIQDISKLMAYIKFLKETVSVNVNKESIET